MATRLSQLPARIVSKAVDSSCQLEWIQQAIQDKCIEAGKAEERERTAAAAAAAARAFAAVAASAAASAAETVAADEMQT